MATPSLAWYLCDFVTGLVLEDLPIQRDSDLVCNLLQENQATLNLPVLDENCPEDWATMLTGPSRMIVLTINDMPAQGWWIRSTPPTGSEVVAVAALSFESYAANRTVPDLSGTYDDAEAAYRLCTQTPYFDGATGSFAFPSLREGGGFDVTYTASNTTSDYSYATKDGTSVLSALQDGMFKAQRYEVKFGIRWTDSSHRGFTKTITIAPRIGSMRPDAVFDRSPDGRGSVQTYSRFTASAPVTSLMGSTSVGSYTATSDPVIATDLLVPFTSGGPGFPFVEQRTTFDGLADSANTDAALAARTAARAADLRLGKTSWSFVLNQDTLFPGVDFDGGDTVKIEIDPWPVDPIGGRAWARVQGFALSLRDFTVTPTLWVDPDDN